MANIPQSYTQRDEGYRLPTFQFVTSLPALIFHYFCLYMLIITARVRDRNIVFSISIVACFSLFSVISDS